VWPAGPAAGPLGLRVRGVVVALIGTDGSGKTTVAAQLDDRLRRLGLPTASAYFGMGRGNLPGVALARRLLGVSKAAGPGHPVARTRDRPLLRRIAAWYYAGEYVWRYARFVAPQRWRRRVVLVDRWVYDLRESPWPESRAATVICRIIPRPDILVLPDAPLGLIHARQPERPYREQASEQERYRALLTERPAGVVELVVDTSGAGPDGLTRLVAAVVEAAHGPREDRRER
ncbi:MAG: thymidylate kinase, partial [Dactylosporangium sp.]|nr:thymidylate kinase [Dactylosporangium sp.]NNJ61521.1 thymidylate kinase [Dactylosporangium sp.]